MSGGRNLQYIPQAVPKFLQQFKQQTGYKEGPTVQDKFAGDQPCVDSDHEKSDDEGPVVVVLKPGDLTKAEAEKIMGKKRKIGDDSEDDDDDSGKVKFRQPKKKTKDKENGSGSEPETKAATEESKNEKPSKKKKKKRPPNGPKNLSLLSFDEGEDR
ncbi:uncharacterized protein KIAA1143 homolog [Sycon ciliatum]|uniref:uncharacterized protein KIAA1143 homolog n=1 Tax=Sycon ciliatum TaxID=27933 RepID=UPI0020A877E9|eukprot:scpid96854/ scgid34270/ Uncharacterized protein KIAA1143 homolog